MRFLRFLFIAFASVVALVVAVYLVVNVVGVISAHGKRDALGERITDRIAGEAPSARQRVDAVADRVSTEPTYSWTAQHCDFATNDGGWIVQDYREVCSLESVHAWQVDSEAEALAVLDAPAPVVPTDVYRACHTFLDSKVASVEGVRVSYIEPSAEEDRWCEPTDREYSQRRPASGEELHDLDNSLGWLVVVEDVELVDEVIGCAHWTVVFCTNPFGDRPAWGEPAA